MATRLHLLFSVACWLPNACGAEEYPENDRREHNATHHADTWNSLGAGRITWRAWHVEERACRQVPSMPESGVLQERHGARSQQSLNLISALETDGVRKSEERERQGNSESATLGKKTKRATTTVARPNMRDRWFAVNWPSISSSGH
jgi:hypothetical protein